MLVYIPNSGRVLIPETESTHGGLDGSSLVTHTGSSELVFTQVPVSWFSHTFFLARAFTQVSVNLNFLTTGNTWNFTKF